MDMENRVGDNIPAAVKLAEIQKKLGEVVSELEKFCIVLSKDERKRMLRARKDSEPMVQRVADLASRHKLSVPGVEASSMLNDVRLTQVLQPIAVLVERANQLVQDTTAQADTEAWQAFLAYYGVLSSLSGRIPEIEGALAPVVEYMRPNKKPAPEKPAPEKPKTP